MRLGHLSKYFRRQAMTEYKNTRSQQENMDLIRAWVDAINRNDIDGELACWQPDGEFVVVPTGMTYRGRDEIGQAGQKSASAVGGQPIQGRKQITHLDAGDDWACVEYDTQATITGPIHFQNVTLVPEGVTRDVVTKACVVFQIRNGLLDRAREYFDAFSMAQQLGLDRDALAKMYASLGSKEDLAEVRKAPHSATETVSMFIDAWNRKDLDGVSALLGEQVTVRNPMSKQETIISKAVFRSVLQKNMETFPDLQMRVDRLIADGEPVAIEELENATFTVTNQSYLMPVACFVKVNPGGLIIEMHNYWDTDTYFRQLRTDPEILSQTLYGSPAD
jgi:steroid delta-isomerase-like uncharacterized protein